MSNTPSTVKSFLKRTSSSGGFSIIELSIVIVIIGLLVGIVMHSITAKQDSQSVALNATVKTLNEALLRAKLSTDAMTPGTAPGQFSKQAALDWYLAQGYISFQGTVDVDKVNFSTDTGFWEKSTTSTNSP